MKLREAPFTQFGKTVMLPVVVYNYTEKVESDTWDEELWIERGEDWYALGSHQLKGKLVRIIIADDFRRALRIQERSK